MGTTPPTLDYAPGPRRSHLRKWTRRILPAILLLACLYGTPLAWLYWGWKQEQPAREMVARVGGSIEGTEPVGPTLLRIVIPGRLGWIRERITAVNLSLNAQVGDDELRMIRHLHRLKKLDLSNTQKL